VRVAGKVTLDLPEFFSPAVERSGGVVTIKLLIGGERRPASGEEVFEDRSPIDGSVVARAAKGDAGDVEAAIDAARAARQGFRGLSAAARLEICQRAAQILGEHADELVGAIVVDLGREAPGLFDRRVHC
jgi:benzaldehyde dehydrogenase (NAD)